MKKHVFQADMTSNRNSVILAASIAAIFVVLTAASCIGVSIVNAQKNSPLPDDYIVQKTGESGPDPLPGHQGHQLVMAIPPRDDGKIWTGTISWTASYPVETVILHAYDNTSKW